MKGKELEEAIKQAELFIEKAKQLLHTGVGLENFDNHKAHGTKLAAQTRRRSLDLSDALVELRRR